MEKRKASLFTKSIPPEWIEGRINLTPRIKGKLSESSALFLSPMPQQKSLSVRVVTPLKVSESPDYPGYFLIELTRNCTLMVTANEIFALHAIVTQSLSSTPKKLK